MEVEDALSRLSKKAVAHCIPRNKNPEIRKLGQFLEKSQYRNSETVTISQDTIFPKYTVVSRDNYYLEKQRRCIETYPSGWYTH